MEQWNGFLGSTWREHIDVANFIKENYTEYTGDESFLIGPSQKTNSLYSTLKPLLKEELEKGIYKVDVDHVSGIDQYQPGYIDKENEVIVGLQTDEPLKRIVNPFGGMRMVKSALKAYEYELNPTVEEYFKYRKT